MYNQETAAWRSYPMANPARRPAIDSDGKVWAAHYFGNAISRIDPVTGTVTEFELPLKDGNPYDVWPDADDNLWVENGIYNSLVRFDQVTGEFTYFPFPELRAHTPKLDRDRDGTLWFTLRGPSGGPGVAALKPTARAAGGRVGRAVAAAGGAPGSRGRVCDEMVDSRERGSVDRRDSCSTRAGPDHQPGRDYRLPRPLRPRLAAPLGRRPGDRAHRQAGRHARDRPEEPLHDDRGPRVAGHAGGARHRDLRRGGPQPLRRRPERRGGAPDGGVLRRARQGGVAADLRRRVLG